MKPTEILNGLQYYFVAPEKEMKCLVLFVHGLRDHVMTHRHFFNNLVGIGCGILSFDLGGHGLSLGKRCSVEDYRHDVDSVTHAILKALRHKSITEETPIVLMGYSYGFPLLVHAMDALLKDERPNLKARTLRHVKAMIGLHPALKVGHVVHPLALRFGSVVSLISRFIKKIDVLPFSPELISDDESVLHVIKNDPHVYTGKLAAHTTYNVHMAGLAALELIKIINVPMTFVFGEHDFVGPITGEDVNHRDDVEVVLVNNTKHNSFDGDSWNAGYVFRIIHTAIDNALTEPKD
ncbi:MAG: alpha/beta fold hydrolase [Arenicellales bacterium]|jgi:alpha-beta hydrolase superfamily lysophospholipase